MSDVPSGVHEQW